LASRYLNGWLAANCKWLKVAAKHCKVYRGNYVVTVCLYILYFPFVDIVVGCWLSYQLH